MNNKTTQVLYEWSRPASYSLYESNQMLGDWKGKFFRTLLFILVFEFIAYFILSPLPFDQIEFDLKKALLHLFTFGMGVSIYAYLAGPYFIRFNKVRYIINEKGIRIVCNAQGRIYPWGRITECDWSQSYVQPFDMECIIFQTSDSPIKRRLLFDKEQRDLAKEVYHHILSKVANCVSKPLMYPSSHLDKRHHLFLWVLTVIISLLGALISSPYSVVDNGGKIFEVLLLMIFCGAGTLGLLGTCKRPFFQCKDWIVWIVAYNIASMMLTLMFYLFIAVFKLAEIIGTTS